ncbi:unnamed protein product [Paramecium sonneborni]|uniref:RyR/IP3R Homology associated domain-containing protein n=1 Tax=Paramecium sonneborni TaxID=65129 RepID=A0A8S1R905_9CILI|nr:unnamed protein product [Paramecium sonneborni]
MLWLKAIDESLAQENIIAEPITRRQCMAIEIGCIDYVNKIIYELNINELLYQNQDQILQHEHSQEINSLIDALSSFLQLVCNNSTTNSIYILQWYNLYKHILLNKQVNDKMRLDILIIQLFQQTDMLASFESELSQIVYLFKFTNYQKNILNLLIAFCQFTEFRNKQGIKDMVEIIFQENKYSIFSKIVFDGNIQLMLKECTSDQQKSFMIESLNFPNKSALKDYIISCARLVSEISKSSSTLTLQQINDLFPFKTIAKIIQDIQISSQTKFYFLVLFQNSYMAEHFQPLPRIQLPQYLKMVVRQDIGKGLLGLFKKEQSSIVLFPFAQKKISNLFKKVQQRYLVEGDDSIDFWLFLSEFITQFQKRKTIYEIKGEDHTYMKQLILTFLEFLSRGLLIEYLQDDHNFYDIQHKFIEFLKNSVASVTLQEKYIKHTYQKYQDAWDYLFENTVAQRNSGITIYSKSMIWLVELIEILIYLEQFQQSRMVDQFIISEDNYVIFDDLLYLQKFAKYQKYADEIQKLRQAKDMLITQELTNILEECSYARKTIILEYMRGIKQLDINLVQSLIDLLILNQIRLSAKVIEFLWLIYSSRSNFLNTINQTILIQSFDQRDLQLSVNQNIFNDFSNIYWKLHFASIDLIQSLERDSSQYYETINDVLSEILLIFFPNYAPKSDQEEKIDKSKVQQEISAVDQKISHQDIDLIDQSQHMKEQQQAEQFQSQKSVTMDSTQKYVWKINNSFSLDVFMNQLKNQQKIQFLTAGIIFRKNNVDKKVYQTKTQILEKSILILIYFVIRNKENQELLLNLEKNKDQFLYEMSNLEIKYNLEIKQQQTLIQIFFAELFRDNYNILFSLEKYNDENTVLPQLFSNFYRKFQYQNYEACIYFLQFLQILLKVKENDVVQNYYVIVQLFMNKQNLNKFNKFAKDIELLMTTIQQMKIEQFYTATHAFENQQHLNHQKPMHFDSFIEMPTEILFFKELIRLLRIICSKRSGLVNDFIKKIFPISRMAEMIQKIDEWYPLKYELLLYFQCIFLDNLQHLDFEEKQELVKIIKDTIFKQIIVSFVENKNLKKFAETKLMNSTIINIFGIRNQYSNQEFIMSVQYKKSSFIYIIFGVLNVIKQFIKKLYPKYFQLEKQEYFDDKIQNEIVYNAQNIYDDILRAKDFTQDGYENPGIMRNTINKGESGQQVINLTHKQVSSHQNQQNQELSKNEQNKDNIIRIIEITNSFQQQDLAFQLLRNDFQINDQIILEKWTNSIKPQRTKLIDEHLVTSERENEILQLINLIITLKRDDTEKFQKMITSLIRIFPESSVSSSIKLKSVKIIRKLSNYKEDTQISKSILKDLEQLGLTDYLCDLIKYENDQELKLEYIKAFVDYIDNSSRELQNSFLSYLQRDQYNTFIISLQNFITQMFQDLRMTEISKIERNNRNINKILNNKINGCILIFELFRLGCQDHFTEMQNFLRHQVNSKQPVNFIMFTVELFEKYVEIKNEDNVALGQKLLDFLIEYVQGPCLENQMELCKSTKILEVLERIILQQSIDQNRFQKKDIVFSSLQSKVFLLFSFLMEGNSNKKCQKSSEVTFGK